MVLRSDDERDQLLAALSTVYSDLARARLIATRAGYPHADLPEVDRPRVFWTRVLFDLEHGKTKGGVQALVDEAARDYPAHPIFGRLASAHGAQPEPCGPGWSDDDPPVLDPFPGGRDARTPDARELPELIAVGRRQGATVRWAYHRSASGPPFLERETRWDPELGRARGALASAAPPELQRLGLRLGRLLLGRHADPDYHAIARTVLRAPEGESTTALAGRVRCRLILDPELERLPWRLAAVEDVDGNPYWLTDVGWTFEHGVLDRSRRVLSLPNPCSIMFVVPQHGPQYQAGAELVRQAKEQLGHLWPPERDRLDSHVAVVHDRAAAVQELRRRTRPEVVVFFGRATPGPEPCLELYSGTEEDGEVDDVPLVSFVEELAATGVKLLVLATTHAVVVPPVARGQVPCIVAPTIPSSARDTVFTLQSWLRAMLAEGLDPVRALHRVPRSGPTRRWCAMRAHADFERWTIAPAVAARVDQLARRRIDRDEPRALFIKHVEELVADPRRRVEAFVALGGGDDRLDWLGEQLKQECKDRRRDWKFLRRKVRFPGSAGEQAGDPVVGPVVGPVVDPVVDPAELDRRFDRAVFQALALDEDDALHAGVERAARRGGWPRSPFVYWLDWGARLEGLDEPVLAAWLRLATRTLPRLTEGLRKVRVISTVAVVPSDPDGFYDRAIDLAEELQDHRTAITVFDPLGLVTPSHLMRYLRAPDITSCPESLVKVVARTIVRRAGGRFRAVIDMIERAERDNRWHELAEHAPSRPRS